MKILTTRYLPVFDFHNVSRSLSLIKLAFNFSIHEAPRWKIIPSSSQLKIKIGQERHVRSLDAAGRNEIYIELVNGGGFSPFFPRDSPRISSALIKLSLSLARPPISFPAVQSLFTILFFRTKPRKFSGCKFVAQDRVDMLTRAFKRE